MERAAEHVALRRHGASGDHETLGDRGLGLQAVDIIVVVCALALQGVDFRLQIAQPLGQDSTDNGAGKTERERYEHHGQEDRRE